jgi:hypothetical protein
MNPYTFSLCFSSPKNICSPPPSLSKLAKLAQFDKEMGKLWGCKGAQCSMMDESKQIRILNLKLFFHGIKTRLPR